MTIIEKIRVRWKIKMLVRGMNKDEKGFHHTMGKRPVRSLQNAFVTKKNTVKRILQDKIKEVK